jgi:hypothetical protein
VPIDVEDVATEDDLAVFTLGKSNLAALLPEEWSSFEKVRQERLSYVLATLKKRRPPILENDLLYPAELRIVVCYGTLEIAYGGAIKHEESPNVARSKNFGKLFADALNALQPSVRLGSTASSLSFRISRG